MARWHTTDFDLLPEQAFRPRGWKSAMTLEGGGKGGSSAPPPDPRLVEAQIKSLGVQDAAINRTLALADRFAPLQEEQLQFGLQAQRAAFDQSQSDRQFALTRRDMLAGVQDRLVRDAESFNTEDRRNQLAGEAMGDVTQAFEMGRQMQARGLTRMGVNPNDGRYAGMTNQMTAQEALAKSTAANKVRAAARAEGYALTDRASNALAGYPSLSMQASGNSANLGMMGLNLVNQGFNTLNGANAAVGSMAGMMGSNATGMFNAQAGYKNTQDQIAASNDPWSTVLGTVAGVGTRFALGKFI